MKLFLVPFCKSLKSCIVMPGNLDIWQTLYFPKSNAKKYLNFAKCKCKVMDDTLSDFFLPFFLLYSKSLGSSPERDIWSWGESHEEDSSTRSRQARCTNLRGQSPLFQDLTDKRQAGNPTIEEWLNANVCWSDLRKFETKKRERPRWIFVLS